MNVLENTVEPPVACISLSGGSFGGQGASFNIVSSPGTATGGFNIHTHIIMSKT